MSNSTNAGRCVRPKVALEGHYVTTFYKICKSGYFLVWSRFAPECKSLTLSVII